MLDMAIVVFRWACMGVGFKYNDQHVSCRRVGIVISDAGVLGFWVQRFVLSSAPSLRIFPNVAFEAVLMLA